MRQQNIVDAGQRDINIGMNGVSLKVDSEGFWVASEVPLQVVSSSVGGDLEETGHILSAGVPADPEQREYALRRPRAFVRERARALGISDPVVGLITGLDHDRIQVATYAPKGRPKWPLWLSAPLATVAKTLALFETGVKTEGGSTATGTSLDAMVVASTGGGVFSQ